MCKKRKFAKYLFKYRQKYTYISIQQIQKRMFDKSAEASQIISSIKDLQCSRPRELNQLQPSLEGLQYDFDLNFEFILCHKKRSQRGKYKNQSANLYHFQNGQLYIGEMINNLFEGNGKYVYQNGDYYEGEWKCGYQHGKGVYSYNGNRYQGEFRQGEKYGEGIQYFSNGDVYIGNWKNNLFEGKGSLYYRNGCLYDGRWKNGRKHGLAIITYKDGSKQFSISYNGKKCRKIQDNHQRMCKSFQ